MVEAQYNLAVCLDRRSSCPRAHTSIHACAHENIVCAHARKHTRASTHVRACTHTNAHARTHARARSAAHVRMRTHADAQRASMQTCAARSHVSRCGIGTFTWWCNSWWRHEQCGGSCAMVRTHKRTTPAQPHADPRAYDSLKTRNRTDTRTHTHTHIHTLTDAHTQSLTHLRPCACTHTQADKHTHTQTRTPPLTHSLARSLTHSLTRSLTHSHNHARNHAHPRAPQCIRYEAAVAQGHAAGTREREMEGRESARARPRASEREGG
jgi:hypothetical protein